MRRLNGFLFIAGVVIALSMLGGSSTSFSAPAPKAKQWTLKWACFEPASSLATRQLKMTAELAEKYSNGQLKWEFYPGEQLVKGPDEYEACRDGLIDVTYVSVPYESDTIKLPTIIELPFTIRKGIVPYNIWHALLGAGLDEYYQSFGVKPICMSFTGAYEIWSTPKWGPVDTLEKAKGCKVRAPGGGIGKAFAALGMTPVAMASPETYTALERATLDSSSMAAEIMVSYKLPEVIKYALRTGFVQTGMPGAVNLKVWKSLPVDCQQALLRAGREAEEWRARMDASGEETIVQPALKKAGVQQLHLTPQEQKRWEEKLAPLWDQWIAAYGNEAGGLGNKLMATFKKELGIK